MFPFRPNVAQHRSARVLLGCAAQRLADVPPTDVEPIRTSVLRRVDDLRLPEEHRLQLRIALSVLCDLRSHDWTVMVRDGEVQVGHPNRGSLDPADHKQHVRQSLLVERDAQLLEPATRRFIAGMERQRRHGSRFRSIFSLMRDGKQLADALAQARQLPPGPARTEALRAIIDPYVQVVEPGATCEFTGLALQDIWRYFRHTWTTPYRSVPGRQISFIVRDRAAENHPVIGLGALASSVVQQKHRDRWIGWHPDVFLERLEADEYLGWPSWIRDRLDELLGEIYVKDFLAEGILTRADLRKPSQRAIQRLRALAREARDAHRLYRQEEQHKHAGAYTEVDWLAQADTFLFRAKRAGRLADLLRARRDLREAGFTKVSPERLRRAVATSAGRNAVLTILRYVKAAHVGIDMMDISVCGAVDPYRALLGGKLVALLLTSPDVVAAYTQRYRRAPSIIASSTAGASVHRPPRLVLLMTTSLYGVASSLYNRLKVPPEQHGGHAALEFVDLERTAGFGSYHFSKTTMDAMEVFLARAERGREVNSIFGEGVNPRLRKIRSALEALGLRSDDLLKHGSPRIVYAIPLASNFRDILMGRARRPRYILEQTKAGTRALIEFWYDRWLGRRIERQEVLDEVAAHTTAYPVQHGARVKLPALPPEEIGPLFGG